ncbi:hypothetical protein COS66_01055 [Candidatus Berkelbacteria bacterium CG06_land_8_20_14_3_00_43_10]|uniref:Uncharacterized protein n=1 Tax=Candidatus Berkelbacteria bacterium CG10_big_fil_rev_8_21_14_0_10_43_14 TaxID=1974515 RepID=A0A2M6R8Q6_9BACT|nr:MAG: hypothetical protein AUK41_01095 [Candidatus Berkelbacteria bacterium CG2_30_43_20]PIS06925.1 MAG: hypothetical protein COT79_02070 [Candidatus Berkelbacteria bacterium CG10_big_fil_rev_8_21_14_0_10_43_14]PIU87394.1 MAG: hypothetical protein COS66_01055 [Candidatus Berkelbacteria bacterium CG06_land_8_20_14_3_00_43_10]
MSRKNRSGQYSALLIASLVLAGFGWAISRNSIQKPVQKSPDVSVDTTPIDQVDGSKSPSLVGTIVVLKKNGSSHTIESLSLASKESKILYTDSDEENKIISAIGIRNNEAIIIESSEPQSDSGSLVGISLDGKAQKHIYQNEISASIPPVLNPVNDTILTVSFTPVEKSFGFSIVTEDISGANPSVVAQNIQSILSPTYSPRGDKVLYAGIQSNTSTLYIIDTSSGKIIKQSDIDGIVLDTAWVGSSVYVSLAPKGTATSNKSTLTVLSDELILNNVKVPDKDGAEINIIPISNALISFMRTMYNNGVPSDQADGAVILFDTSTQESTDFDQAIKIIGYVHG